MTFLNLSWIPFVWLQLFLFSLQKFIKLLCPLPFWPWELNVNMDFTDQWKKQHDLQEAISTICFLPSKNVLKQVFEPKQTHWDT